MDARAVLSSLQSPEPLPDAAPADNPPVDAPHSVPPSDWQPRRYSIATVLAVTLALLITLTVASVVTPLLYLGRDTTLSLLRDKGELILNTIELRVRQQMEPTANQLSFIADVLSQPGAETYGPERIADVLTGALAATPQIAKLTFVDAAYVATTAMRTEDRVQIYTSALPPDGIAAVDETRIGGWWSGLEREPGGDVYIVRQHSVWRGGRFFGTLLADISVRQLSNFLATMQSGFEGNAFILYDHDYVLAHPRMSRPFTPSDAGPLLPKVDAVDDPVLAAIWDKPATLPLLGHGSGFVHAVKIGDYRWLFIYRTVYGYGDKPWMVGTYIRAIDALASLRQLMLAGIGVVLGLILAVVTAVLVGRRITRPVTQLATAARQLRGLRFAHMPELPRSSFRELDDQARAFNDMLAALRWFESYVPRKLVRRLAQRRERGPLPSVERQVTVMFTDIVGFTPLSERMSAVETARLLNQHFELVTRAIQNEDGTVDKFIGDSVMAFWGAPVRQQDHAERAIRAASAIATAIREENKTRAADGKPPIRLRIGIHTGPAVVGNIGSADRVNYTIVGDTVNAAQRIEQLGRQLLGEDTDIVVLFSAATERRLGHAIDRVSAGMFNLRGRAEPVPVFRLVLPPAEAVTTETSALRAAAGSAP